MMTSTGVIGTIGCINHCKSWIAYSIANCSHLTAWPNKVSCQLTRLSISAEFRKKFHKIIRAVCLPWTILT